MEELKFIKEDSIGQTPIPSPSPKPKQKQNIDLEAPTQQEVQTEITAEIHTEKDYGKSNGNSAVDVIN